MTNLFLVPVGGDWIDRFEKTVASPLSNLEDAPAELPQESPVRVWGTTVGEDSKKRTTFESMEPDDPILFLHDGEFIASGRVGETFEDPDLGAWLWDSPQSRFIYTVADYQEIAVPRREVWEILGYSPNYPLYGFSRTSDDAISTLLQTYNSVEEAFQDLRSGEIDDGSPSPDEPTEDTEEDEGESEEVVREHTEIQWYLIQLGLEHGYEVYVATNDQNRTYEGHRLGEDCVDSLSLTGLGFELLVVIEGERLVARVIEQECERELCRTTATIPPFEPRGTVVHQCETPLWRELFLVRLVLDDGAASTTVADVDSVAVIRDP